MWKNKSTLSCPFREREKRSFGTFTQVAVDNVSGATHWSQRCLQIKVETSLSFCEETNTQQIWEEQQHPHHTHWQSRAVSWGKLEEDTHCTHWFHVVAVHQWVVACAGHRMSTVHNSVWFSAGLQAHGTVHTLQQPLLSLLMCMEPTCTPSSNLPLLVMQQPADNLCKWGLDHSRQQRGVAKGWCYDCTVSLVWADRSIPVFILSDTTLLMDSV